MPSDKLLTFKGFVLYVGAGQQSNWVENIRKAESKYCKSEALKYKIDYDDKDNIYLNERTAQFVHEWAKVHSIKISWRIKIR